jgi:hypothetical protein
VRARTRMAASLSSTVNLSVGIVLQMGEQNGRRAAE